MPHQKTVNNYLNIQVARGPRQALGFMHIFICCQQKKSLFSEKYLKISFQTFFPLASPIALFMKEKTSDVINATCIGDLGH